MEGTLNQQAESQRPTNWPSPAPRTRPGKGVVVASATGTLAAVVLLAAGFSSWQRCLEWWHLLGLESPQQEVRFGAAAALSKVPSPRVIHALVGALQEAEAERLAGEAFSPLSAWGCKLQEAIESVGKPAAPALLEAMAEEGGRAHDLRTYGLPLVKIYRHQLEDCWEAAVRGSCIGEANRGVLIFVLLPRLAEDENEPPEIRMLAAAALTSLDRRRSSPRPSAPAAARSAPGRRP